MFAHGPAMRNRFMLSPLTNQQSHADGTLSDDEYVWLTMRAQGGFGLTMTCASHVQAAGQGFPGQLGCFDDRHLAGLARLAEGVKRFDSLAMVQLHHAGRRSPTGLIAQAPVAPSDDTTTGARALTTPEVEQLVQDFIAAAVRCEQAGFDGVELHGAHDYILCQFLNSELNVRDDQYGGSLENRSRVLFEIIDGVRSQCASTFNLAVRLSPERFGMKTNDIVEVYRHLTESGQVDFVDLSLWDVFKPAIDPDFEGQSLLELFTAINRQNTRLAVAGRLYSDVRRAIDAGVDIVAIGRAAITNHDFPDQLLRNPDFAMRQLPVRRDVLRMEGLGESFIDYMGNWKGFVED
jgi:2,4-dienoyl-CoA reductase-like NADH-dependent reductase (Old Yellow Enzyme family)